MRIDCDLGFVSQPEIRPETRPPVREMLVFEVCAPRAALKDQHAARCGRDTSFRPPKPPCTERGCVDQSYVHLLPSFGSGEGKNAKKRQNMSVNDIARTSRTIRRTHYSLDFFVKKRIFGLRICTCRPNTKVWDAVEASSVREAVRPT